MSTPYFIVYAKNLIAQRFDGDAEVVTQARGGIAGVGLIDDGLPNKLALPKFVIISVADAELFEIEKYAIAWSRRVSWDFVSADSSLGVYRYRVSSINPGDGRGAVAVDEYEQLIAGWGASIESITYNKITVSFDVFAAICSPEFWDNEASAAVDFKLISYDAMTGEYVVSADYSRLPGAAKSVNQMARKKGALILSQGSGSITISVNRSAVISQMTGEFVSAGEKNISSMRYRIPDSIVDSAVAAGGRLDVKLFDLNIIDDSV